MAQKRSESRRRNERNSVPVYLKLVRFFAFLLLWIAVAFFCYEGYKFAFNVFNDIPVDSTSLSKVSITIDGKESNQEVGEMLFNAGLIDDVTTYKIRCIVYDAEYKPGTYRLSKSYTTEKIINILSGYKYSDTTIEEETTTAPQE